MASTSATNIISLVDNGVKSATLTKADLDAIASQINNYETGKLPGLASQPTPASPPASTVATAAPVAVNSSSYTISQVDIRTLLSTGNPAVYKAFLSFQAAGLLYTAQFYSYMQQYLYLIGKH